MDNLVETIARDIIPFRTIRAVTRATGVNVQRKCSIDMVVSKGRVPSVRSENPNPVSVTKSKMQQKLIYGCKGGGWDGGKSSVWHRLSVEHKN